MTQSFDALKGFVDTFYFYVRDAFNENNIFKQLDWTNDTIKQFIRYPFDVFTYPDGLTISIPAIGLTKDDIAIEIENQILTVQTGKKAEAEKEIKPCILHKGIMESKFRLQFVIAEILDINSLETNLENGLLTIQIKRKPKTNPKKIIVGQKAPALSVSEAKENAKIMLENLGISGESECAKLVYDEIVRKANS